MTWLEFTLGALACYRLSLLVSKEDGPYWIFAKLRKMPPPKSSTKAGLQCQWCVSIYSSALVCLFFWWRGTVTGPDWALYWLAISAGAICINQVFTKGQSK